MPAGCSRMSLIRCDEVACHLFIQEAPKKRQQRQSWGSRRASPTGRNLAHPLINLLSLERLSVPLISSHAQWCIWSICQPTLALTTQHIMQSVLVWQLRMHPWRGWEVTHTKLGCVPQPAPVARRLSIPAPSVALAQWQCLWHMSQSFKCLLFSAGWLGARRSQGKDDILCRAGGNLLWLLSSCLLCLSAPDSSEHIKTQTNKPCHFETPALVTRLLSGMSSGIWSYSPVGGCEKCKCVYASDDSTSHTNTQKLAN